MANSTGNNIILNHNFAQDSSNWSFSSGKGSVVRSEGYACITNRTKAWQGLEQDITDRVELHKHYQLCAFVRASRSSNILASLRLEYQGSEAKYEDVGSISTSGNKWEELKGEISLDLDDMPDRVIFYIEGPPAEVDLHVRSVDLHESKESTSASECSITLNSEFEDSIKYWDGLGCNISSNGVDPHSGKFFVSATDRKLTNDGIQQDITKKVHTKTPYELSASVQIHGNNVKSAKLKATLYIKKQNRREYYLTIAEVEATDEDWALLRGKFIVNATQVKAVIYIEGAPAGTDIRVNSFIVKCVKRISPSTKPDIQIPEFNVNIIKDIDLNDTTNGWFPFGQCNIGIRSGAPREIPSTARVALGGHARLTGSYIHVTDRTDSRTGPAQMITDKIKLYLTYQVSAWVKTGAATPQIVSLTLKVDEDQHLNVGQVEVGDADWHEVFGSFRIEQQPEKLEFYIHGPASGINLMVAGVQIFPVDPRNRSKYLKEQTDKIRKRDVTLKFSGVNIGYSAGSIVKVRQTQNTFPFGSCINRRNIDNEDFVEFFVENFNWAVFENELKWCSTEVDRGLFDYRDADDLVNFCKKNNVETNSHYVFWKVKDDVPSWVHSLQGQDLTAAIENRLMGLLKRYKGKFKHHDVNNEMLDPSFFRDRLGEDIQAEMFKKANELDPSATLFVNDYHVEDGYDVNSFPEKYIQRIQELQRNGAPIGGIGVQGHFKSPVGVIVCSALDKLRVLNLPIWFTELDVSSTNEFVRADDLEIMLREAFAHPSVEGILLWGFWELNMYRENSHLVNAEGDINEAGRRYLALRDEWLSRADGRLDEQGNFKFRGFQGKYTVEIVTKNKTVLSKIFHVEKGNSSITINL